MVMGVRVRFNKKIIIFTYHILISHNLPDSNAKIHLDIWDKLFLILPQELSIMRFVHFHPRV